MIETIYMNVRIVELVVKLIFTITFIGCAIWQFSIGEHANGILWLMLTQLYDISTRLSQLVDIQKES